MIHTPVHANALHVNMCMALLRLCHRASAHSLRGACCPAAFQATGGPDRGTISAQAVKVVCL